MTRTKTTKKLLWSALIGSLLAVPLTLSASIQPEGQRGDRGRRGGRGGNGRAIVRELDLTEEQRTQMRALRGQGSSREVIERLAERRTKLNDAVENSVDEGTLRQLGYELGEAEGDAAIERSKAHAQLMELLTPEQREKYQTLRAEQKQKMEERRAEMKERKENRRNRNPDSF